MKLEILPAVDVKAGQAVRLVQGALGSESNYGSPIDAALDFQKAGAEWIHLVDLDAAYGTGENAKLIKHLVQMSQVDIQLSGGIANQKSLDAALATNACSIVV